MLDMRSLLLLSCPLFLMLYALHVSEALARHLSKARSGLDDYLMVPSLKLYVAVCAFLISKTARDDLDDPRPLKAFAHANSYR